MPQAALARKVTISSVVKPHTKKSASTPRCAACGVPFIPEPRAAGRQKFCRRLACREISHIASQERWLENKKGRADHTGPVAVSRVQDWRKDHPQYWRRGASAAAAVDRSPRDLPTVVEKYFKKDSCDALQDSWPPQVVAFVGLIAWLRGDALQDTIAADIDKIMVAGNDLLLAVGALASNRKNHTITNES
jgi:hypothetical protein